MLGSARRPDVGPLPIGRADDPDPAGECGLDPLTLPPQEVVGHLDGGAPPDLDDLVWIGPERTADHIAGEDSGRVVAAEPRARVETDEARESNLQPGLLAHFAHRGLREGLTFVDRASRKTPDLEVLAAGQQDSPILVEHRHVHRERERRSGAGSRAHGSASARSGRRHVLTPRASDRSRVAWERSARARRRVPRRRRSTRTRRAGSTSRARTRCRPDRAGSRSTTACEGASSSRPGAIRSRASNWRMPVCGGSSPYTSRSCRSNPSGCSSTAASICGRSAVRVTTPRGSSTRMPR